VGRAIAIAAPKRNYEFYKSQWFLEFSFTFNLKFAETRKSYFYLKYLFSSPFYHLFGCVSHEELSISHSQQRLWLVVE
jgi:hypothetical protein